MLRLLPGWIEAVRFGYEAEFVCVVWVCGVHEAFVYDPLSEPLVQMRCSLTHELPYATDEVRLAVTDAPLATVAPHGAVHDCATGVVHVVAVFVHPLHVGDVAPAAQLEVRVCVMEPVCPAGQDAICVCGESGVQVAVAGVQFWCVYVPESCPLVHVRCSLTHWLPYATDEVRLAMT